MRKGAFTLVEMLVVIFVIGLLISILLPCLQKSRLMAQAALCSSNIKQLTFGLILYENENQVFPYGFHNSFAAPPGGYLGTAQYDRIGLWWLNYITDYSRRDGDKASDILCPSRKVSDYTLKNNILSGNYGVNQSICKSHSDTQWKKDFRGTPLSSSDIPRPGQTLLVVDSGYSLVNWYYATDSPPVQLGSSIEDAGYIPGLSINKNKEIWPGLEYDAISGRHPGKTINVGFVDGHVSRNMADDLFVEKNSNTYKNLTPLWVPQ